MGTKSGGNKMSCTDAMVIKKRSPIMGTKSASFRVTNVFSVGLKKDPQSWGRKVTSRLR